MLFTGKSRKDTDFSRRAQIHMHTQQDGPLSISLPPPYVSEGLAGLENRCQVSFHLLCYQHSNVLLQENICLSIDHQQKGPHELAHPPFETRKTLCHSNCKGILSPARFLLDQQHYMRSCKVLNNYLALHTIFSSMQICMINQKADSPNKHLSKFKYFLKKHEPL